MSRLNERPNVTRTERRKARKAHANAYMATNRIDYGRAVDNTQIARRTRKVPTSHAEMSTVNACALVL